jgi:hypothetical protein
VDGRGFIVRRMGPVKLRSPSAPAARKMGGRAQERGDRHITRTVPGSPLKRQGKLGVAPHPPESEMVARNRGAGRLVRDVEAADIGARPLGARTVSTAPSYPGKPPAGRGVVQILDPLLRNRNEPR